MDTDLYIEKLDELEREFSAKRRKLSQEFTEFNAVAKVGQIVSDGNSTIRVNKIRYSLLHHKRIPQIYYSGVELRKDLVEKKNKNILCVFQSHENFKIIRRL